MEAQLPKTRLISKLMSSKPFPYEAPPTDIPAPLPTIDEIERSEDIILKRGGAIVARVGWHFVVKYGRGIDLEEGRTMIFVTENTCVRVPHIYALFTDSKTEKNYIIMERIHGSTLQEIWSSLDESQKKRIGVQLRKAVNALRQIRSKAFESVGNKPLRDDIFWTPQKSLGGPFDSESALNNAIVQKYKLSENERVQRKAEYCKRVLSSELHNHGSVFTHGDLQRKNVMIIEAASGLETTVLIDWETAGFYPTYWEYSRAYSAVFFVDDWESYLREILHPFPREHNMLMVAMNDLGC